MADRGSPTYWNLIPYNVRVNCEARFKIRDAYLNYESRNDDALLHDIIRKNLLRNFGRILTADCPNNGEKPANKFANKFSFVTRNNTNCSAVYEFVHAYDGNVCDHHHHHHHHHVRLL